MRRFTTLSAALCVLWPVAGRAVPVGYSVTITTAYANGDPFPSRLDTAFIEADTGFIQIANSGKTTFSGVIGTIAVSAFAGDLSYRSAPVLLPPAAAVSVAVPDDASSVGGFNGPAYEYRPGVEIYLNGTMSDGTDTESVNLLVADRDVQSGVWSTDQFGLASDSFVLQGGDPWGFDTSNAYALALPYGVFTFSEPVPEPASLATMAVALAALGPVRSLSRRWFRPRQA